MALYLINKICMNLKICSSFSALSQIRYLHAELNMALEHVHPSAVKAAVRGMQFAPRFAAITFGMGSCAA